jgi:hypothetical protein
VKHTFRALAAGDTFRLLTKKSVVLGDEEPARTPAREARLGH